MLISKRICNDSTSFLLSKLKPGTVFIFTDGTGNLGDELLSKPGETPGIWRVVTRSQGGSGKGVDIISIDGKGGLNNRQPERLVVPLNDAQCFLTLPDSVEPVGLGDLSAGDIFYDQEDLWQVTEAGPKITGKISAVCLRGPRRGELSGEWDADRMLPSGRGNSVKLTINLSL